MEKPLSYVLVPTFLAVFASVATAAAEPKVTICHFPPGNPAKVQVITVGQPAIPAHVSNHNDAVCPAGDTDCCFGGFRPSVCTNFRTDLSNCGKCSNTCPVGDSCLGGNCVPPTPTNTPTSTPTSTPTPTAVPCVPDFGACTGGGSPALPNSACCGDGCFGNLSVGECCTIGVCTQVDCVCCLNAVTVTMGQTCS